MTERVMVWHGWERDPKADPAASDVMAAYRARSGRPLVHFDCYLAGVEAWRQAHPDQSDPYARRQAVAVILAAKEEFLLRVPDK